MVFTSGIGRPLMEVGLDQLMGISVFLQAEVLPRLQIY